jgi:hypothetical protein
MVQLNIVEALPLSVERSLTTYSIVRGRGRNGIRTTRWSIVFFRLLGSLLASYCGAISKMRLLE